LRGSTRVNRREQPRADYTQDEKVNALRQHRHLEETCKERKVDNCFRGLTVIGGP
jgi:hypothetical protein